MVYWVTIGFLGCFRIPLGSLGILGIPWGSLGILGFSGVSYKKALGSCFIEIVVAGILRLNRHSVLLIQKCTREIEIC